ncbi:hypothetical protein ACFE04_030544 [Oxalis oulophora]
MSPLSWLLLQLLICTLLISYHIKAEEENRKIYIVYMGERAANMIEISPKARHINLLQNILGSDIAQEYHLHSFHRSFDGFVVKLTENEAELLRETQGVVSVFQSKKNKLHTTRSWEFLGFGPRVKRSNRESNIIVGMFDQGVWPESESFNDKGFGPPPRKWKGTCKVNNFTCNNKIIGAKAYRKNGKLPSQSDYFSPRDQKGHGTHTASTAAGGFVSKASFLGLGKGTARGGVPSARIAVYKVCWSDGCSDEDILAAFDDAIADGVDIISVSLGLSNAINYFEDSIAIGTFHAMKHGILTSSSAGNDGPKLATAANVAPWFLSVAASNTDRKFLTTVQLGDGKSFQGVSLNTFALKKHMYPLIYGGDAPSKKVNSSTIMGSKSCLRGYLDAKLVRGKIVICDRSSYGPYEAGAAGVVIQSKLPLDDVQSYILPLSRIGLADATSIFKYLNSTRKPTATILKSTEAKDASAPSIASYSSRGPNAITDDILKPDLAAPGTNILAAWSLGTTATGIQGDKRVVPFNIISGTSMACPHVTAIAAYVKSFHPRWSPSAVMSALKTTASPMSAKRNPGAEFAYGSGHINPLKVNHPGLLYDAGINDYIKFLCGVGYTTDKLRLITGDQQASCSATMNGTVWNLNYPSFTLSTTKGGYITREFHRTVTNVGLDSSNYRAIVKAGNGMTVKVTPSVLSFKSRREKKSFVVQVTANMKKRTMISGSLIWDDGKHKVRSPIVAHVPPLDEKGNTFVDVNGEVQDRTGLDNFSETLKIDFCGLLPAQVYMMCEMGHNPTTV